MMKPKYSTEAAELQRRANGTPQAKTSEKPQSGLSSLQAVENERLRKVSTGGRTIFRPPPPL
jgi:hypothetical protein